MLSGGGASGMAHIGVLKSLEENHIPIDYIVGTSIGALVGGFYAAGYSPEEIEKLVTSEQFKQAANGEIDEDYVFYLKRNETKPSMISWRFNLDSLFEKNIPTNFISSVPVDYNLMKYFAKANAVADGNFDSLYVPFRCIASNISQKKQMVFRTGDLASSVRASMTYPFFIAPISINGHLMLDGGLYNNFPVDVLCEEFQVDHIISSNVSSELQPPTEDNLISQIRNILIRESMDTIVCTPITIINSNVEDIPTFNFNNNQEVIARGYQTTNLIIDTLKSILSFRDSVDHERERSLFNARKPDLTFSKVEVEGLKSNQTKYLVQDLKGSKEGSFTSAQLEPVYMKLASDEKIKSIYPVANYIKESGDFGLYLKVKKEKNFKASFGGVISTKPFSTGFFELGYQHLGATGLHASGNIFFGNFYSSSEGSIKWEIPFDLQSQFTVNQYDFFNSRSTFIEENDPPYIITSEQYWETKMGLPFLTKSRISFGGSYFKQRFNYYQNNNFGRSDTSDLTIFEGTSSFIKYEINTLNHKLYATKGSRLNFMLRQVEGLETTNPGSTSSFADIFKERHGWLIGKLTYEKYFFERVNFRLGTLIEGVYSEQPFFQNYTSTLLSVPAFKPLPEMHTLFQEQYRALAYAGIGLKGIYTIREKIDFRLEAYLFQPYEALVRAESGQAREARDLVNRDFIGTFTSVYHTRVGPLAMSFNFYDDARDEFSFLIHFGYVLFNKPALE